MKKLEKAKFGEIKIYKGKAIIAYIDILGFSNSLRKKWFDEKDNPLQKILDIKNKIPSLIEDEIYMTKGKDGNWEKVFEVTNRVQTISDSFIISYPIELDINTNFTIGLSCIIKNIILIWKEFIKIGYTIRGGISFGEIYWDEKEIIGPAFIDAYETESKIASCSRVVLSSECNKYLKKSLSGDHKSHLEKKFLQDNDGFTIVNPQMLISDKSSSEIIENLKNMKNTQRDNMIKAKYISLIHHFEKKNNHYELIDY